MVYITDYEILKKRQDRGWPIPRLGQGSNPDLWWRMSRALISRQGTFTVQWQRAHVVAADIKHENHDTALVFGNKMVDAVAKQAASEAALRGAAAEQVAWVDALAWLVQRRIVLVRWLRAGPCAGEIQTMQSNGNSLGLGVQQARAGAYFPIGWKIVHPSHSVAQYQGITCWSCAAWTSSISVQTEHAMLWDDQGVSA